MYEILWNMGHLLCQLVTSGSLLSTVVLHLVKIHGIFLTLALQNFCPKLHGKIREDQIRHIVLTWANGSLQNRCLPLKNPNVGGTSVTKKSNQLKPFWTWYLVSELIFILLFHRFQPNLDFQWSPKMCSWNWIITWCLWNIDKHTKHQLRITGACSIHLSKSTRTLMHQYRTFF